MSNYPHSFSVTGIKTQSLVERGKQNRPPSDTGKGKRCKQGAVSCGSFRGCLGRHERESDGCCTLGGDSDRSAYIGSGRWAVGHRNPCGLGCLGLFGGPIVRFLRSSPHCPCRVVADCRIPDRVRLRPQFLQKAPTGAEGACAHLPRILRPLPNEDLQPRRLGGGYLAVSPAPFPGKLPWPRWRFWFNFLV